jgi:hypothetical protein
MNKLKHANTYRTWENATDLAGRASPAPFRQVSNKKWSRRRDRSALNAGRRGEHAELYLRSRDLYARFKQDAMAVLEELDRTLDPAPRRDLLFALSDLSYLLADRALPSSEDARRFYMSAARGDRSPGPPRNGDREAKVLVISECTL